MAEPLPRDARIFVAGHRGMVGSAVVRALEARRHGAVLTRSRSDLDLTDQAAVRAWFRSENPDYVIMAAARVGGIQANNTYRADFIQQNLAIQCNVFKEAFATGVQRLLFLGSSCIYPKFAPQPIPESALLTGPLEPTNQPYAIAKIAGIEMCDAYNRQHGTDFRAAMPTNLYGLGDNFDLNASHVIPALMLKFHQARERADPAVTVWGTGTPRREFLHVDDLAQACLFLMELPLSQWRALNTTHVNVGCGEDVTIADLAALVKRTTGYAGAIEFDASKPDGTPRKLLDVGLLRGLGWAPHISLEAGLADTYRWFKGRLAKGELRQAVA
ncbi:MAG TPA: GDP-L-fucose synthase [Solimonas sp.]|nr:GDP-L-fucose synthase [Solimonas sp.]